MMTSERLGVVQAGEVAPRGRRTRRVWLAAGLLLIFGAGAGLCATLGGSVRGPSIPTSPPARVLPARVSALGRLAPEGEVIALNAGSAGEGARVDRLQVEVGSRLAAGQLVAVLDGYPRREAAVREAVAKVEVSRAKLAQVRAGPKQEDVSAQESLIRRYQAELRAAERNLGRAAHLLKKSAIPPQDYDDQNLKYEQARESLGQVQAQLAALKAIRPVDVKVAETELNQAEAGLAVAQADLRATQVRSPIAGSVLRIHARPGERVGNSGILDVGNVDVMHAVAEVYEQDVGKVRVGQLAQVRVPTLGTRLSGRVVRKDLVVGRKLVFDNDPVADTDARVVEVRIELAPQDSQQVAGLSNARVEIVIDVSGGENR
jgi:HlyD family secretion protein